MKKLIKAILFFLALPLMNELVGVAGAQHRSTPAFSHDDYAAVLKAYVDDEGMVFYEGLKAKREQLDTFVEALGKLETKTYTQWSQKEKNAFWLNAYNALTLKAIVDNYPIKSSLIKSLTWPENSIRQIDGVWDKIKFNVMSKMPTLEHMEQPQRA